MSAVILVRRPAGPALRELLGEADSRRLDGELLRIGLDWAREIEPQRTLEVAPEDLEDVARLAWEQSGGPLLIASSAAGASLRREHAESALSDMQAGLDLSLGPATDGGWYLLAMQEPRAELLSGGVELGGGLLAAQQQGLAIGLLRSERELPAPPRPGR